MFLFKEIWKLSVNWRNFFLSVGILFIWMIKIHLSLNIIICFSLFKHLRMLILQPKYVQVCSHYCCFSKAHLSSKGVQENGEKLLTWENVWALIFYCYIIQGKYIWYEKSRLSKIYQNKLGYFYPTKTYLVMHWKVI